MHLQELRSKISEAVVPVLVRKNAFMVDLQVRMERRSVLVQVFADTDEGITIQQCAELNREMLAVMESTGLMGEAGYRLEVSSPGMDRPLTMLRQYRKNIGRKFRVRFRDGGEERTIAASLSSIDGDRLTFSGPAGDQTIAFEAIVESREELPW